MAQPNRLEEELYLNEIAEIINNIKQIKKKLVVAEWTKFIILHQEPSEKCHKIFTSSLE